ncbi:UNVERIFIED_CONTAM: hypothetical protein FKN15_034009 [Acipenser sinensis]
MAIMMSDPVRQRRGIIAMSDPVRQWTAKESHRHRYYHQLYNSRPARILLTPGGETR